MRRLLTIIFAAASLSAAAKSSISFTDSTPQFAIDGRVVVSAPAEGLWSVATGWEENWMCDWHHASREFSEVNERTLKFKGTQCPEELFCSAP